MKAPVATFQKSKGKAVANALPQSRSVDAPEFQFADNRAKAVSQRKLQELAEASLQVQHQKALQEMAGNSPRTKQFARLQHSISNAVVQRAEIPATVNGLTHIVQAKGGSIFDGEEVQEVRHGTPLLLDTSDKIRSRRGPNQEYNRATDLSGAPEYRWVRVLAVNNRPAGPDIYIRDDAVSTDKPQPFGPKPSALSPDHRQRDGALPNQKVILVGTNHDGKQDKSGRVQDEELNNADLILEHPTHRGRGRFIEDPSVSTHDKTQKALMDRAGQNGPGARVIGADGRKLTDAQGMVYAISSKNKGHQFTSAGHVDESLVTRQARQFVECSLGLRQGDIQAIIAEINAFGTYKSINRQPGYAATPNLPAVLTNDYVRVLTITKYFKPEVKQAIANRVMAQYQQDVQKELNDLQENIAAIEGYGFYTTEEVQNHTAGYRQGAIDEIIGHLRNAVSNLTLLSEALASNKSNLIVSFGSEHMPPLKGVLEDVHGLHKNYRVEDRT